MKLFVTGTDGYIGIRLAEYLMDRGHDVTALDSGFYRSGWLYGGVRRQPATITKDTRDVTVDDLRGFDAVIHLAELCNDPLGQMNAETTRSINHRGSVALAKAAKEAGVPRFIYSSSCSVYGIGSEGFMTEESPVNPQTTYAECKVAVEHDLAELADDTFSPVFLRNATVYGASPRMRFDLVVNNLAGFAWTTNKISMTSDGTPWRPVVHVLDVCQAMACAAEAPREAVHNEIFNVGSNAENYRVREIADIIASVFPGCEVTFGTNGGDTRSYRVSFDKIEKQLPGFACKHSVRTGSEDLRKLFERIDLTPEMFTAKGFSRLQTIEYLQRTGQADEELHFEPIIL